ncbi:hypothetical protein PCANC_21671, partial [Puccinia coronata f. sp. avenae]
FHYTNELLQRGRMELEWIAGVDQLADVFTKALGPCLLGNLPGLFLGNTLNRVKSTRVVPYGVQPYSDSNDQSAQFALPTDLSSLDL